MGFAGRRVLVVALLFWTAVVTAADLPKRLRSFTVPEPEGYRLARGLTSIGGAVTVTDPAGDVKVPYLFDAPNAHASASGATITATLPIWIVGNATSLNWDVASYPGDAEAPVKITPPATWTAGSTSQVTSAAIPTIPDYGDPISASISQSDSQHITLTVTARGPVLGQPADFEFEFFEIGVYLDVLPWRADGIQTLVFVAPHLNKFSAASYLDITSVTGQVSNGVVHFTSTVAAPIPATPPASDGVPVYRWWFQNAQKSVAIQYDKTQSKWVMQIWLYNGHFTPEVLTPHGTFSVSGNTITWDIQQSDFDFPAFSWYANSGETLFDGPDTWYTKTDFAPDKAAFTTPPLTVTSFTATPATIRPGQQVTLAWATQGASNVSIDNGIGTQAASGSVTVTPAVTTTYTLTATQDSSTVTATAAVNVLAGPIINVTAFPAPMLQPAGTGGAQTSYAVTNSGGSPATIALTQSSPAFFSQSPSSFTLAPGGTQVIAIAASAQPAGSYEGTSTVSGGGATIAVPVKLLSAAPPAGSVTADASTNRVDVAAAAGTNPTGSVTFTNHGSATLTGILSSDVPWIIPQSGIITIAPGQTVTLTFTIDRSKRPDASALIGSAEGSLTLSFLSGSGSSFAKGPFDATAPIPSVSLVKVIDTVKPAITTAGIPALAAGEVGLIVPGVGHVTGTKGTLFVSDVSLLNPQGSQAIDDVKMYYTPLSGTSSSAQTTSLPSVGGQVTVAVADVVKNVFNGNDEVGTLHIRSKDADKLNVAATVLTANNPGGTFGNSVPVFRTDRAVDLLGEIWLTGVRKDATTHTNLYIQEMAGSPAKVQIYFLSETGTIISQKPQDIDAFKLVQLFDAVPAGAVAVQITNNSTAGGKIAAYATPVDETSTDTWVVADWAEQLGYAPSDRVVIPVAGSLRGANNTFYRTDVAITNRSSDSATAVLRYVDRNGTRTQRTITLAGKQSNIISDVVGSLFGVTSDSSGYLMLNPQTGIFAVSSRTFTTSNDKPGTYGTGVPAIAATDALTAGASLPIAGLADANRTTVVAGRPGTYRTNFALMETSGQLVTVRVIFRFNFPAGAKAQGIGAASRDYALNGYQFLMLNSIAGEILGPARLQYGDLTNVEADFQVLSGDGSVVLFTSSVDNATGDSILRTE